MICAACLDDQGVRGDVQVQAGLDRGGGQRPQGVDVAFEGPRFQELAGQVAARRHQERAGTHRDVGYPEREDLFGRSSFHWERSAVCNGPGL